MIDVQAILADGHVDLEETQNLRAEIYGEDGDGGSQVTEGELRTLFQIKDGADSYVSEFGDLVVEAAVSYALEDPDTPGVVDAGEAAVLNELIQGDGEIDEVETRILTAIRTRAESVHPSLIG